VTTSMHFGGGDRGRRVAACALLGSGYSGAVRFVFSLSLLVIAGACAEPGVSLEGWDVTITQSTRCTLTGQLSRNCEDPAVLAQTSLSARWFIERIPDGLSTTLTTHEGRTIPGVTFDNDGSILNAPGCDGDGGRCVFVRRRFETVDANNNNCTTFGELMFVGTFPPDDDRRLTGRYSDLAGNSEECGTPTVNEVAFTVEGTLVDQPALSLEEAAR
jgi:hypothetical protein